LVGGLNGAVSVRYRPLAARPAPALN